MKLAALGEFAFLKRLVSIRPAGPGVELGIGDDCAVVRIGRRRLLVTTDALVEGTHFRVGWDTFDGLGKKAFAVNASDIAAMGGRPLFAVLAVGVPRSASVRDLDGLIRGFAAAARDERCSLVGGNLTRGPGWSITVTLIGEPCGRILTRSGARPGDSVWVSGTLGGAAWGRSLLERGGRASAATRAFRRPSPRLSLGQMLARSGIATAAIDVSDGLLQDLGHLCRASRVRAVVDTRRVPMPRRLGRLPTAQRISLALAGGEDYEIVFTTRGGREKDVASLVARAPGHRASCVGRLTKGSGLEVLDEHARPIQISRGFDHFRQRG